ncbi:MAG: gamma-glutamyltransferase, partial [Verrucomicrobiota bacterium]
MNRKLSQPRTVFAGSLLLAAALFGMGNQGCEKKVDRPSVARKAMVSAAHPDAVKAGVEILEQGGNAMDAAVAVGFTLAVVEPHSAGIGGGGFLVYYEREKNEVSVLDYRETAPAGLKAWTDDQEAAAYKEGGLSVGVPGMVKGMIEAHEKYGRLPFAQLLESAVVAARDGFARTPKFNEVVMDSKALLEKDPIAKDIFFRDRAGGPTPRETFVQADLARTLEAIRYQGLEAFYGQPAAEKMAAAIRARGGVMTAEDIMNYRTRSREPLRGTYRGYEILTMCPPSGGGMKILLALKLLEAYDLKAMGDGSPEAIALTTRAHELAARFCDEHVADPDVEKVDVKALMSNDWAREMIAR